MMEAAQFARFAVYWAPEDDDALRTFGGGWLGHDPATDRAPDIERASPGVCLGLSRDLVERVTAEPKHYGLHATLKAPFRLKPGITIAALKEGIATIARDTPVFAVPALRLTRLKGFLALCPSAPSQDLAALAARCVQDLDPLRAPLTASEHARRNPAALTPSQVRLLDAWGYPNVFEEFRFHITLTGRLSEADHDRVAPELELVTRQFCAAPFTVRSIALFGDPGNGRPFRLVQRFALASA